MGKMLYLCRILCIFVPMKKIRVITAFGFVAMMLVMMGCSATSGISDGMTRAERKILTASRVRERLAKRHYKIDITMMQPQNFPARALTTPHFVEVAGDSIYSYLPYYGRAYSVSYGGGAALDFEARITAYSEQRIERKHLTRCRLLVKTDEDSYVFTIEVFDNATSTVDVHSQNRDFILFSGEMDTE